MTETEWLASTEPVPMLEFLHGKASDRKLRLFARLLDDPDSFWVPSVSLD